VNDPQFGWLAFGGNLSKESDVVKVTPLDSARSRIYVAPYGLWLTLDAGNFVGLQVNARTGVFRISFAAATQFTPEARLRIEQPAKVSKDRHFRPITRLRSERQAYVIPLTKTVTSVEFSSRATIGLKARPE